MALEVPEEAIDTRIPVWRRTLCVLTGGHKTSRVEGMRYGALVTCGRCGWRRARW